LILKASVFHEFGLNLLSDVVTLYCFQITPFNAASNLIPKSNYPLQGYKNTLGSVEAINNNLRQIQQRRQLNLVAFITEMPSATPTKCNSNMQHQQQQQQYERPSTTATCRWPPKRRMPHFFRFF